jgi:hypothetical protein
MIDKMMECRHRFVFEIAEAKRASVITEEDVQEELKRFD